MMADAEEMALLLLAGEEVGEDGGRPAQASAALEQELLWQLREIYDALVWRNPDAAPYVAVVAMNRLRQALGSAAAAHDDRRQTEETLISQTDMGLVGEILFARMDALKNHRPRAIPCSMPKS